MTNVEVILISDAVTVAISLYGGMFVAGARWSEVRHDIAGLKEQVAEIKGMFVVKIRGDRIDKD